MLSLKRVEELRLLELYNNIRLERYIFAYNYLIRLILKKLKKKRKIAYLSLSIKRSYNVRVPKLRILSDSQAPPWHVVMA